MSPKGTPASGIRFNPRRRVRRNGAALRSGLLWCAAAVLLAWLLLAGLLGLRTT